MHRPRAPPGRTPRPRQVMRASRLARASSSRVGEVSCSSNADRHARRASRAACASNSSWMQLRRRERGAAVSFQSDQQLPPLGRRRAAAARRAARPGRPTMPSQQPCRVADQPARWSALEQVGAVLRRPRSSPSGVGSLEARGRGRTWPCTSTRRRCERRSRAARRSTRVRGAFCRLNITWKSGVAAEVALGLQLLDQLARTAGPGGRRRRASRRCTAAQQLEEASGRRTGRCAAAAC